MTLIPPDFKKNGDRILQLIRSGSGIAEYEIKLCDKFSKKIDTLITFSPIKNKFGKLIGSVMLALDHTQHKLLEKQSAIQLRVATALVESGNLDDVMHSTLKTICEILDFQLGEIWIIDSETNSLCCTSRWSVRNISDEYSHINHKIELHLGEGVPGHIWETQKTYWSSNLNLFTVDYLNELYKKTGLACCFGLPIFCDKEIIGVLLFFGKSFEQPDISSVIMLEGIGNQIGIYYKRIRSENRLLYLAQHDLLTGLANKLVTEDILKTAIENAKKNKTLAAIAYLDLDHFKSINDTLGHYKGDTLIKDVALRLQQAVDKNDVVARFGGDEFAIIFPNVGTKNSLEAMLQKILDVFTLPFLIDKKEFYLTVSMGVSVYPDNGDDTTSLLRTADLAMYEAKILGGNNYQISSPTLESLEQKKMEMEISLHTALKNNEFILYYQPVVNIQTNKIINVEALLRWKNPNGELISPAEIIPLLEQSDLILSVGEWVIRTACQQIKEWQQLNLHTVAVNVSAHQLNRTFVNTLKEILEETKLKPENLVLEITESILMQTTDFNLNLLSSINKMGVLISIDDFGTGYSSFSYLKNFNMQYLKIDKAFINDVTKSENAASIVNAIIVMAHILNMKTIAEGVETQAQLDFLKEKGCDKYQGYLYSKPVLPEEITELLRKTNDQ